MLSQVAIGQYLGSGGMTLVAQLCPMLKGENGNSTANVQDIVKIESAGVGIATMTVVGFLDIYYCVIIAWTFFYLFATYSAIPDLPWATCGNLLTLPSVVLLFHHRCSNQCVCKRWQTAFD